MATRSAAGSAARGTLPFRIVKHQDATRQTVGGVQHVVVIDSPAAPSQDDLADLGLRPWVIPTAAEAMTLGATVSTVATLRDLGATFKTLLTILPPPPSHDGDEARAFLREQKIPTFKGGIRRAVAFQKASLAGVPVYEVPDPRAEMAWADNAAIGKEIIA